APDDGSTRREERAFGWWPRRIWVAVAGAVAFVFAGLVAFGVVTADWPPFLSSPHALSAPAFVGSEVCAGCHQTEAQLWRGSQHSHAMAPATEKSVLGDFSGVHLDHYGVRSRFFRKDG